MRVRQDPASFTVILDIKNVLPESLEMTWSADNHGTTAAPAYLRFMLTCASRGGGGCTLDWGVVLHCPAPQLLEAPTTTVAPEKEYLEEVAATVDNEDCGGDCVQPKVLCCDFSATNVALTFAKPEVWDWWESIAIGRGLGPGLQVG